MLLAYYHGLADYLYDVFVARFDFWLAFGIVAQLLFTARFIVQWIASERAGRSVMPMASASEFIVEAVPIVLQWPADGADEATRSTKPL